MNVRDLIPWGRGNSQAPTIYREENGNPFLSLHREINRVFDDMFRDFDGRFPTAGSLSSFNVGWPSLEISETDKELKVSAEMPGLEEKDVEVLLDDGVLTVRGEKKSESHDKDRHFSEHYYGRFERRIPIDREIKEEEVSASFKNGVLTITLPKTEQAQSQVKRIAING